MIPALDSSFAPDAAAEAEARSLLLEHFVALRYFNPEQAVADAMAVEGSQRRLLTLLAAAPGVLGPGRKLLVSGMGSGTEMLAARRYGVHEVHGTEVDPFYVRLCSLRFRGLSGLQAHHYDGQRTPFEDAAFDALISGHIVEHTADPAAYLAEQLRVLKPGGAFLLEFPTRYHWKELHTGLLSAEWLPSPLRYAVLRFFGSRFSPLSPEGKRKCRVILETALKQVSKGMVLRWLRRSGFATRVLAITRPDPGVVKMVLEKVR